MTSIHSGRRARARRMCLFVSASLAAAALPAGAQDRFATEVVAYSPGPGGGIFDPLNALGGPRGAGPANGSVHVTSLGVAGSITLGFDVVIRDGPGVDLTVFENGFVFNGGVFAEVAFVEVSSDGAHFARFPSSYDGPPGPLPAFGATPMGTFSLLTGAHTVIANVISNGVSPFDPVVSGGESFDLAWLAADPLVLSGLVDLSAIHFVRLVDVPEGQANDAQGVPIWDNGGPGSSADIDAVAVVNHAGNVTGSQPVVDLFLDPMGRLSLRLEDPDGFADLDLATLHASFDFAPMSLARLSKLLPVLTPTPDGVVMSAASPYSAPGAAGCLSASVRDDAGESGADQIVLRR